MISINLFLFVLYVDKAGEVARHCEIQSMPTFKLFQEEKEIGKQTGFNPTAIEEMMKKQKWNSRWWKK